MAGVLSMSGTPNALDTKAKQMEVTVLEDNISSSTARYNAATGVASDQNFFQELTQFIGIMADTYDMEAGAVIVTLEKMLASMRLFRSV